MAETWTVLGVLEWTARRFAKEGIESPRLEAQVLLAHVLGCDRVALYTSFDKPLSQEELGGYRSLIRQRLDGMPVAYLTGSREFWSRSFDVDSRVLIPRPDSEILVEVVLGRLERDAELDIMDVGTGSGILAVTLAAELPHAKVVAVDLSAGALEVAAANARRHDVASRIEFHHGNLFEPIGDRAFDVIVANLPYLSDAEMDELAPDVRKEPGEALAAGQDGLDCYRPFSREVCAHLRSGGLVAVEHGYEQGRGVRELFEKAGLRDIETHKDLGGRERLTVATRE